MEPPHHLFNRARVRAHRDRAHASIDSADFLLREMAENICGRLEDLTLTFPLALDLGAHNGMMAKCLSGRGGTQRLVQTDLSFSMLQGMDPGLRRDDKIVADEELLPFAENMFDLVMSAGSLHWVNDLPGALIQIHHALKPGGLFIATLPGGETLKELRVSLEQAEFKLCGGISPRISPFIDVRDGGSLLQRAGFAMPVADTDMLNVSYPDMFKLMRDLRAMGETNALMESARRFARRGLFSVASDYYKEHFGDGKGRIPATFELVTLTGWKKN